MSVERGSRRFLSLYLFFRLIVSVIVLRRMGDRRQIPVEFVSGPTSAPLQKKDQ